MSDQIHDSLSPFGDDAHLEALAARDRQWADAVLFARHEVTTSTDKSGKARGRSSGARLLHTQWTAAFDAKNRFDLPDRLPLDWEAFARAIAAHAPADPARLRAEVEALLPRLSADRREAARAALEAVGNNAARLAILLDRVAGEAALASDESEVAS